MMFANIFLSKVFTEASSFMDDIIKKKKIFLLLLC